MCSKEAPIVVGQWRAADFTSLRGGEPGSGEGGRSTIFAANAGKRIAHGTFFFLTRSTIKPREREGGGKSQYWDGGRARCWGKIRRRCPPLYRVPFFSLPNRIKMHAMNLTNSVGFFRDAGFFLYCFEFKMYLYHEFLFPMQGEPFLSAESRDGGAGPGPGSWWQSAAHGGGTSSYYSRFQW